MGENNDTNSAWGWVAATYHRLDVNGRCLTCGEVPALRGETRLEHLLRTAVRPPLEEVWRPTGGVQESTNMI